MVINFIIKFYLNIVYQCVSLVYFNIPLNYWMYKNIYEMDKSRKIFFLLTSYLTLWKSLALLSRTVNEWLGFWSPLKMNDISPLSHLISLKSTRVVSNLIEAPLLWILHISDGNTLETNGTESSR